MNTRLEAKLERGAIVVTGKSTELLKFKTALSQIFSVDEITYLNRKDLLIPLRNHFFLNDVFSNFDCDVSDDLKRILEKGNEIHNKHLSARKEILRIQEEGISATGFDYWDSILAPYQGVAVNCMITDGLIGLCLFDEQGTGKSLCALATYDILKEKENIDLLILIGPKSLLGNWKEEFKKFIRDKYEIAELEGSGEENYKKLKKNIDVYLINYESVSPILSSLKAFAESRKTMLVIDESYFVKNPDAKRSISIRDLRKNCNKAFVLCGTPSPNRAKDIIHQFDIADDGFTFSGYISRGDVTEDRKEVSDRVARLGAFIRRTKEEVLPDLPKKQFKVLELEMVGKQALLYEKAKRDLVLYLRNMDNTSFRRNLATYFQRRAALLQICVSPRMIDRTYDGVPTKYSALDELLRDFIEVKEKKVIVWSVYTRSIDDMENRYSKYGLVRLDGTISSSSERTDLVKRFQNDSKINIFIGNPAAAGAGLNLHSASNCVYVSFSNQAAHYLQSLDRVHRIGQKASEVSYHFLLCRNTIEENELKRLSMKERSQKDLLGDSESQELTLESALSELGI